MAKETKAQELARLKAAEYEARQPRIGAARLTRPWNVEGEKNTLLSETARAAWADLTRTHPRDRTAADLSPAQQAAFAKAWSVDGDGIYRYNSYDMPSGGPNSNAFSPGYWFNKDPNHQVEKLFGRGTASWTPDGDLVFNDTYDLNFGEKNLPGVPTNADPDEVKIRSRISARGLGLDPKKLWETANTRIQDRWAKLEPVMDKVYQDVQAGRYEGQVDPAIQEVQALQARYNRINSGPYKPETASTLATWKHPKARWLEELGAHMDNLPSARISTRQAAKGGDASGSETEVSEIPVSEAPQNPGGPRIVINPTTFRNKKDALCVAFNEGFRLWMEANDFQPRSEPTDAQRKFFSDTAYADDELQLRRTILARIATFDTSVKDPTDDQLAETAGFLGAILESDWCKNEWERDCVSRLAQAAQAAVGAEPVEARQEPLEAREAEPLQARAAMGGGETDDEEKDKPGQAVPAQETDSGMDGVTQQEQQDVNGDGTAIDHSADYEAQLDLERQEDMAETNAEYEKLRQSGALDDLASFDNSGQTAGQGQPQEPGVSARPGGESGESGRAATPAGPAETGPDVSTQGTPRRGGMENGVVSKDSPGSLSYRGPRQGGIENGVVSKDSPGSLSYRGPRRGGIENPIVDPTSQGSIEFSGVMDGGIESPIVDPNSPGSLSYRRRRRRKR